MENERRNSRWRGCSCPGPGSERGTPGRPGGSFVPPCESTLAAKYWLYSPFWDPEIATNTKMGPRVRTVVSVSGQQYPTYVRVGSCCGLVLYTYRVNDFLLCTYELLYENVLLYEFGQQCIPPLDHTVADTAAVSFVVKFPLGGPKRFIKDDGNRAAS